MSHLHHKVSALVDGELQGGARQRALAHASQCPDCYQELAETLALKRRLLGLAAAEPSADLFATLGSVTLPPLLEPRSSSRVGLVGRRLLLGVGTVSVAMLSLAYVVGAPDEATTDKVAPPIEEFSAEFAGSTGRDPLADPAVGAMAGDFRAIGAGPFSQAFDRSASPVPAGGPFAAEISAPFAPAGDSPRAITLLREAMQAPEQVAYNGTREVVTDNGQDALAVTYDIQHSPEQGTSFELTSGGSDLTMFLADRDAADSAQLAAGPLAQLIASYDISVMGTDQVLGRRATVITMSRGGVASARFWVDDRTGLLLRRELYDNGQVARSSTFLSLHITRDGFLPHLPPAFVVAKSETLSMDTAAGLNDQGWACPDSLAGFALSTLHHVQIEGDVMHAAYTDGLSTVSVFEERGRLDPSELDDFSTQQIGGTQVYVSYGLPTVAVWESEGTVYTVVTDAPAATAAAAIAQLPHQAETSPGFGSRVGNGFEDIGSFFSAVG